MFRPSTPGKAVRYRCCRCLIATRSWLAHSALTNEERTMSKSRKPTTKTTVDTLRFDAFTVRDYEIAGEQRSDWSRIGSAWPHQDGEGFRVLLHALPLDGVVTLRLAKAKEPAAE
jgi:hypothetical protein